MKTQCEHAKKFGRRGAIWVSTVRLSLALVFFGAAARAQQGPGKDADIKQADVLAAKGDAENMSAAFRLYERAALAGNADAMFKVGNWLFRGIGTAADPEKAFSWFQKAAAAGHVKALNNLAYCYLQGTGVPKDPRKAFEWFEKGAKAGIAASTGNLGWCYERGEGVARDYQQAVKSYESAVAAGDLSFATNLGSLYETGNGVAQDFRKAADCYKKGAANGDVSAMRKLGALYEMGKGLPQDYSKAMEWYRKGSALIPVLCRNLSSGYVLDGVRVPAKRNPVMLGELGKTGQEDARTLASMRLELDRMREEFDRDVARSLHPDEVLKDLQLGFFEDLIEKRLGKRTIPTGVEYTQARLTEIAQTSFRGLEGEKKIRALLNRFLASRPATPLIEEKDLPILYRAENKRDVELAIENKTGRALHDCVVITEAKVNVQRINEVRDRKVESDNIAYGLTLLLGGEKDVIKGSKILEEARWDYERADKGVVIFVPEWPADSRLETILSPIRTAMYSESAHVTIWSVEGQFQAPLSYKRMAEAVTRAFPQQPAPTARPRRSR